MSNKQRTETKKTEVHRLHVLVSDEDFRKLEAKLKKDLRSVSQFIRDSIAGYIADN